MKPNQCGCPGCVCEVSEGTVYNHDGELYCSEACATHHQHGEKCPSADCHCESSSKEDDRDVNEGDLDSALEETFPASDPISP